MSYWIIRKGTFFIGAEKCQKQQLVIKRINVAVFNLKKEPKKKELGNGRDW